MLLGTTATRGRAATIAAPATASEALAGVSPLLLVSRQGFGCACRRVTVTLIGGGTRGGAEAAFLRSLSEGDFVVQALTAEDYARMADLVELYRDRSSAFGAGDVSVSVRA